MRTQLTIVLVMIAGCGGADASSTSLIVSQVDTVVSTESDGIAFAIDLDVDSSGAVIVADYQANQILKVDPASGNVTRLGREGSGPGEFKAPWAVRWTPANLFVIDQGNGRLQRLTHDGVYQESQPVTPMVMYSFPSIRSDGSIAIGSEGRDSSLVLVFDSSAAPRRYGQPIAEPPEIMNFATIKAAIANGEVPPDIRNSVVTVSGDHGDVWMALQTEAEVRRYDASGSLKWSIPIDEPELASTRAEFFRANAAETDRARFHSLQYFSDMVLDGERVWLLLQTPDDKSAVVLVLNSEGVIERRIEVAAGGATSMAVDARRNKIYLYTAHDAQLLSAVLRLD